MQYHELMLAEETYIYQIINTTTMHYHISHDLLHPQVL